MVLSSFLSSCCNLVMHFASQSSADSSSLLSWQMGQHDRHIAGTSSKAPTAVFEKDGSWGAEMGVIRGLGTFALMWALLSESQDVLLTQILNQASSVDLAWIHESAS